MSNKSAFTKWFIIIGVIVLIFFVFKSAPVRSWDGSDCECHAAECPSDPSCGTASPLGCCEGQCYQCDWTCATCVSPPGGTTSYTECGCESHSPHCSTGCSCKNVGPGGCTPPGGCSNSPACTNNDKVCANWGVWKGCSTACMGGCNGCDCKFFAASMTATKDVPCINNTIASRNVTISGTCTYCGTGINFTTSWGTKYKYSTSNNFGIYDYSIDINVPENVVKEHIRTGAALSVLVEGNRIGLHDSRDSAFNDALVTKTVVITPFTYENFFYCPKPSDSFNPDFEYYPRLIGADPSGYFNFYTGDSTEYSWDECVSDPLKNTCSPVPIDCVDTAGATKTNGTVENADNDAGSNAEWEVCLSRDIYTQGGWLDADVNPRYCAMVDGKFSRTTEWLDCLPGQECTNGKNTFKDIKTDGLCCGDDYGEIPIRSEWGSTGIYNSSCCLEGSTHRCVDKSGVCTPAGVSQCYSDGMRATCLDSGEWDLAANDLCKKNCTFCDINKDGTVNNIDVTAISTHYTTPPDNHPYDSTYDSNRDGIVSEADYNYCKDNFWLQSCFGCHDGVLQPNEPCMIDISNHIVFNPTTPIAKCVVDSNKVWARDNTTCSECTVAYPVSLSKCIRGNCSATCGSDADCTSDQTCNLGSCQCETIVPPGCPPPNTTCANGSCSLVCPPAGCIANPNGVCDPLEGCGCPDCLGQQDGCSDGAICDVDHSCKCPDGTTKCADGTCSDHCEPPQGCIDAPDGVCSSDEGCACLDCDGKQDSCLNESICIAGICGKACVKTEDPEVTLDDGIDNDCDGLTDEPVFWPGNGVYIWEANCRYFVCAYTDEAAEKITKGTITVTGSSSITNIAVHDWESDDSYSLSADRRQLTFASKINNDIDCVIFSSDAVVRYDINASGSKDISNIYLGQRKQHPVANPFSYASPECALSCNNPSQCGLPPSLLCGKEFCSSDKCIFDCGGYWIDVPTAGICSLWEANNPGDYCETCKANMTCSNYTNQPSCNYDPCFAASTQWGCQWNITTSKCVEKFNFCPPGTTLCMDGTCSQDCEETDWKNADCIGAPNDKCEVGEGCACSDCEDERDSCTLGAICGTNELCGCPENTTLCNDNTCDETCDGHGGKKACIGQPNNVCDFGEGCACSDCQFQQDSCAEGLLCNYGTKKCEEFTVGNCPDGETLCNDMTCDDTCEGHGGKRGCAGEPNGKCERGEGCACADCHGKRDSCAAGNVCNYDYRLCEKSNNSSGGGGGDENCVDSDDDGYYKKSTSCVGSDDCNDADSAIHPGAIELCNNKDDDCNGKVDDSCIETMEYGIDLSLDTTARLRILDTFKLKATIKNNLDKKVSDLTITLDVPDKSKFLVKSASQKVSELNPKETKEVYFDVIIKDYEKETATFKLNAKLPDSSIATKDIPLNVEIPGFLIAPAPSFSPYEEDGMTCFDLYYALNEKSPSTDYDIELDIVNPSSIFGKSVFVDYVSSVEAESTPVVRPMISNPYCLPNGNDYEIRGYLYKGGAFKVVDTVDESVEPLSLS